MKEPNTFQEMFQTAAHIKEYQLNQDKQNYDKLPEFYKTALFHWQSLSNVHNQSFYLKKCSFEAFKNLAKYQLDSGNFEDASYSFSKGLAIFKYIKSSNLKWKTDGGIKDWELTYIDDEGSNEYEKKEIKKMKISSLLNISLCEFYNKNWVEVRAACDEVIKLDNKNVKAYYRKARSYLDCPSSLMDDYLKARDCLEKAYNIDNNNEEVKTTLDNLYAYIQKEKNDEKKIFKSFYRNVNYKYMEEEEKKKKENVLTSKDENNPLSGKAQLRMLDLILEMCHAQYDIYERQGNKKEMASLEKTITKAKNYRDDLQNLIEIDFKNPNEKMKNFAEKEGLDLKAPKVQESIINIKKKYIDEINQFHQDNLLLMQNTNEKNKKVLDELKMKKREHKARIKQNKLLEEKEKKSIKNIKKKENKKEKSYVNKKVMIISFILLSITAFLRYYYKNYIQNNSDI